MLKNLLQACPQGSLLRSAFSTALVVTLAACGGGGGGDTSPDMLPSATNLQLSPVNPVGKDSITFSAACSGNGAMQYTWNFGDGSAPSHEIRPTHQYASSGKYPISLTCTDGKNRTAQLGTDLTVLEVTPPTVQFASLPSGSLNINTPINFKAIATTVHSGQLSYLWDFGDGTSESGVDKASTSHSFRENRRYTVKLTVSDSHGGATQISSEISVGGPVFSQMPESVTTRHGKVIPFTATAHDSQDLPVSYRWDFGDGTPVTVGQRVLHAYAQNGEYLVKVTADNGQGGMSVATTQARIVDNRPPSAPILQVPANNETDSLVTFTATSTDLDGDELSYLWDFGDGQTSQDASPQHRYAKSGQYTVKVSVTDGIGNPIQGNATLTTAAYFKSVNGTVCEGGAPGKGWCWQSPRPTGQYMVASSMVDGQTGWVITAREILKTSNGGGDWQQQSTPFHGSILRGIATYDDKHVWVSGNYGFVASSSDGGVTWTQHPVKASNTFEAIAARDANNFIAVGINGAIVRSTEGDPLALRFDSGTTEDLRAIKMLDPDNGWVVGNNGTILKTSDAGRSWVKQYSGVTSNLKAISVVSKDIVWVVGENGVLLKTLDGGKTWQGISSGTSQTLSAVAALDGYTAWAAGMGTGIPDNRTIIIKTIDGGNTLSAQYLDQLVWFVSLHAINSSTAIAVANEGIYRSFDGVNWQKYSADAEGAMDIGHGSGNVAWYVGQSIYGTRDGGASWQRQFKLPGAYFNSVAAVDENNAWVAGFISNPALGGGPSPIMRTRDGGKSWVRQSSGTNELIFDIASKDGQNAWAVGYRGLILHTSDGGEVWSRQNAGINTALQHVVAVDRNTAWAVGDYGTILKTEDGGESWIRQTSGSSGQLLSITMLDKNRAWVVGYGGVLLQTVDGGKTWSTLALGYTSFWDIQALDDKNLWAVGSGIFRSSDGGVTWNQQLFWGIAHSISVVDYYTAWAADFSGVLRTIDGGNNILNTTN